MTRKRIAIVGAGFSGVCLAAQLAGRGRAALRVTLIDKAPRFGLGLAYGTQDSAHLLNVRATNMSAFADKPDDFATWYAHRGGDAEFAPRPLYGQYLRTVLAGATGLFAPIVCRRGAVVACVRAGQGWRLRLQGGGTLEVDAVVLATGNRRARTLQALSDADVPVADAWDARALRALPKGDVLLIGTGLTMVDAALSLAAMRKGVIYALSRHGLLPRTHAKPTATAPFDPLAMPASLSAALALLRREAEALMARGEPWQAVMDRLRPHTATLWRRLPVETQRRFLRHARTWWDVHRHRMAPSVATQIAGLQQEGRLRVLAGEFVSATQRGRKVLVLHRQRGSMVRHRLEVAAIVNCTGPEADVRKLADPLFEQMLSDGLMRAHPTGVGLDVDEEGRVLDAAGLAQPGLFALGPPTQGAFWEATAVPDIRVLAARMAQIL